MMGSSLKRIRAGAALFVALTLVLVACGNDTEPDAAPEPDEEVEAPDEEVEAPDEEVEAPDEEGDPLAWDDSWPEFITIATGTTGGTWYPSGGVQAELLSSLWPVSASGEATAGDAENVRLLGAEDAEIGWASWSTAYKAYHGLEIYEGEDITNLRGLGPAISAIYHFMVRADSDIHSMSELHGLSVASGAPGSGSEIQMNEFMPALGYDGPWNDMQQEQIAFADSADALRDRRIDVGLVNAGPPNATVADLAETTEIRILEFTDEEIETINSEMPYFVAGIIPGGTYSGIDEDVQSLMPPASLFVHDGLSEDFVYALAHALYGDDGWEYLTSHQRAFEAVDFELVSGMPGLGIPMHPGAQRYWEEQGLL